MAPMTHLELRISDADRERAAAVLHAAVSDGRLTWVELEERLVGVYASRTGAELEPCLPDRAPHMATASSMVFPMVSHVASSTAAQTPPEPLRVLLSKVRRRPDP